jgi:hypothetical protein
MSFTEAAEAWLRWPPPGTVLFHSFHAGHVPSEQLATIGESIGMEFARLSPAWTQT